jgi:mono/diheme cytochrome c family protein
VSRFFPPAPDLGYPAIQARADGYLYATVVLGGRAMPIMREGLSQVDLWDLVHYVRTVKAKVTP